MFVNKGNSRLAVWWYLSKVSGSGYKKIPFFTIGLMSNEYRNYSNQ